MPKAYSRRRVMTKEKASQNDRFNILAADVSEVLAVLRAARLCLGDEASLAKKLYELMCAKDDLAHPRSMPQFELAAATQRAAALKFSSEERDDMVEMLKVSARFEYNANYRPAARKILTVVGIEDYSEDFRDLPGVPQIVQSQEVRAYREERSTFDTRALYVPSEWELEPAYES